MTKLISIFLNVLSCFVVLTIILFIQDFFGKGDTYSFLFWTIPIAVGLSISGQAFLSILPIKKQLYRFIFILFIAIVISFGWILFVYLILGPWIYAFSFPVFYIWIVGNLIQLIFLDVKLSRKTRDLKISKFFAHFLYFPFTLVITTVSIFFTSIIFSSFYGTQKETYLIPDNFKGNFRVIYGEACGITPSAENDRRVLIIPNNGILIIKPKFEAGGINHEYYFTDKGGGRKKINEISNKTDITSKSPGVSFIGSGNIPGEMPNGSFSSESPEAIYYSEFTLFNKSENLIHDRKKYSNFEKLNSLTIDLVKKCRKENKNGA